MVSVQRISAKVKKTTGGTLGGFLNFVIQFVLFFSLIQARLFVLLEDQVLDNLSGG